MQKKSIKTDIYAYKQEEFEDIKGVIRICKSEKDRQHNGKKELEALESLSSLTW